ARAGEKAYEDLIIGIHENVHEGLADKLIPALKETISEFSKALYTATKNSQFLRTVKISLPYTWSENVPYDEHAKTKLYETSEIKLAMPAYPYLNQPYTKRVGGCGIPGMYIHITPAFILKHPKACQWSPRGLLMVREWAKFRWGVFDEVGYLNDGHYPLYRIGKNGYEINACTPGDDE
ncbi:unnamed protein product, partial [Meganyctiphanes norvegica]